MLIKALSFSHCKFAFLTLALLLSLSSSVFARPTVDMSLVPDYDYTQTHHIILYGDGDYVVLANPFEYPAPVMGALVYELILMYASQFQIIENPPSLPTHTVDLIMLDRYGERRIGQRLYLGETWLSDGNNIAYLSDEDYQRLTGLLFDRYSGTERSSSEKLAHLRRPQTDELPDSWLPQRESVVEAASRMRLGEGTVFEESSSKVIAEQNAPATKNQVIEGGSLFTQESSSVAASEEPHLADDSSASPFTETPILDGTGLRAGKKPNNKLPIGTLTEKEDRNGWVWTLSVFALISFLMIGVKKRSTNR